MLLNQTKDRLCDYYYAAPTYLTKRVLFSAQIHFAQQEGGEYRCKVRLAPRRPIYEFARCSVVCEAWLPRYRLETLRLPTTPRGDFRSSPSHHGCQGHRTEIPAATSNRGGIRTLRSYPVRDHRSETTLPFRAIEQADTGRIPPRFLSTN